MARPAHPRAAAAGRTGACTDIDLRLHSLELTRKDGHRMLDRRNCLSLLAAAGVGATIGLEPTLAQAQPLGAGVAAAAAPTEELSRSLRALHGSLQVSIREYDGTTPRRTQAFDGDLLTDGPRQWQLTWDTRQVPAGHGWEVTLTCTLEKGEAEQTALSVDFPFERWTTANYVMIPGIIYNGNRYRSIGNGYNPAYPADMYYDPMTPTTISNNPRLAVDASAPSRIELATTSTAAPAMSFFSPGLRKGWIVLTEQGTRLGNSGLSVEESASRESCEFSISAPVVRRQVAGFGDFRASDDRASNWAPGDAVSIRLQVFTFDAEGIPAVLQKFMDVRKSLTGPTAPRNLLPMSKLAELGTKICRGNFTETKAGRFYLPENNRDFQLGWVSGMINTYPMLALNDPTERGRVSEELDFVCSRMQGRSGFFYGTITQDARILSEKSHPDFPAVQAMVRKNGDVLFWLMKHMMLLKAQGHGDTVKESWEKSAGTLADAFSRTWQKHGEFGQYIVPETGDIAVYNSSAGAIAPAGLTLAAAYFNRPEWLAAAEEAAEFYYDRDIKSRGFTGGACADISQDADSETSFGLLESFMALYQYTGKEAWLKRAEVQAALCSSWTLAYNPRFPEGSAIARLKGKMAGAVWASSQNKHAAPGVCTSSADHLFKLYRATGDKKYAELISDIQHAHSEAVNMPGHITTNYLIGSSMERIQPSDAEGKGAVGNFIKTRNSWTETDGILMALELPGIYVRPGEGILFPFDHVEAEQVSDGLLGTLIRLTNNTAYPARVSVLAETARQAARPLGCTAFLDWPRVDVPAGEAVTVRVTRSGKVSRQA
ncbi:hypothetical protein [Streptomyces sp. NPDC056160]|uniref:hypothetical protein n=1 Tax=Streptomyces sp. NPDC056160 TaxID=3345731 RepID=UPI0035D86928